MPVTRLIIFEALAVNAGSALTPIGNPQNLFLSQLFLKSISPVCGAMLPLALIFLVSLLLLTACAFSGRTIALRGDAGLSPRNKRVLYLSLALYFPFLVCIDLHQAETAMILMLAFFLSATRRDVLAESIGRCSWYSCSCFSICG